MFKVSPMYVFVFFSLSFWYDLSLQSCLPMDSLLKGMLSGNHSQIIHKKGSVELSKGLTSYNDTVYFVISY